MGFLSFIALLAIIWLLWTLSRNTSDALDKQTALHHQMVALEKRLESLVEQLAEEKKANGQKAKPAARNRRSAASKSGTGSKTGAKSPTASANTEPKPE